MLFDQDYSITGMFSSDLLPENPQLPEFQTRMFGSPTVEPDGTYFETMKSTASKWFDFDQSKITTTIQDAMGSVIQSGAKSAVQYASDAINRNKQNANPTIARLFQNFSSTQTGTQIEAGSMAIQAQNFLMNPIVWLGGVVVILLLLMKK